MSLIECKDIVKTFGEKVALNHVSLSFNEGKILGLLGPNGSGKTTLIRIINRITIPNEGVVYFNGNPITQADVEKIGYLPEERGLYRKIKVGEQVMYLAQLKGMTMVEAKKALNEWFERFGITSWWDKKVEELSKGMAQKVQFITTVVHKPSLMILDEPFSGFDPVNAEVIRKEIIRLKNEGATIILSTHNMESVEELCDDIGLINKSNLIISGAVKDIRKQFGFNSLELIYTGNDRLQGENNLFEIVSYSIEDGNYKAILKLHENVSTNDVLGYLISQDIVIKSFREIIPRMNDIFIKLVTEQK